ncbi:MAG: protein tlpB [Flavobacterium sp.]|nr:MAG: protein tlpB [Flavobacterium sp.]
MTNQTKNNVAWALRIIVGFLFLISAVAKMYPSPYFAISTFEVKQLYPMGFSESFAPFFSRILIGAEFALGLLLLQNHYLKRFVIPATLLMLIVFTTHLSIETFVHGGNTGNCGCFGSLLPMTPIEAILKNVVAMGLLAYLFTLLPAKKGNFWILLTVFFASVLMVFMLAPIQPPVPQFTVSEAPESDSIVPKDIIESEPIAPAKDSTPVSAVKTASEAEAPKVPDAPAAHKSGYAQYFPSIDKGRKTLCFFVPGCDHCKEAAKELTELKKNNKDFPEISIIFMNEEADLIPAFFDYAGAQYPYKVVEIIPFWKILGSNKDTPGVKYLWNGNEYAYFWGITENKFDPPEYLKIVKKPYSELKK